MNKPIPRSEKTHDSHAYTPSWPASLTLEFEHRQGRSVMSRAKHFGPLRVQRPFFPEGETVCHVYLLHPPGGLVSGDNLKISVTAQPHAHALLTTPAAGKVYGANHSATRQIQTTDIRVQSGATVEWLPQDNIIFDGAAGELNTLIALESDSNFAGWEITCLGRPAGNRPFEKGFVKQRLEVSISGEVEYVENIRFEGGHPQMTGNWGLQGHTVNGTLVWAGEALESLSSSALDTLIETVRNQVAPNEAGALWSISHRRRILIARYLGSDAESARNLFEAIWSLLRPALLQRQAVAPRIWRT